MQPVTVRPFVAMQAWYYVVTGLWPVFNMRSFEWITGRKAEHWLVKTVGMFITLTGLILGQAYRHRRVTPEIQLLGSLSGAILAGIDFTYWKRGRLGLVYLGDGVIELLLCCGWIQARVRHRNY